MFIHDVAQFAWSWSWSWGGGGSAVATSCAGAGIECPGSSFTALGAAFATQGMFVQADLIHYLLTSDFGLWAPLLYILSAAAGMVGVAIGMPAKSYMWFFLGPAFYHWLIATPVPVNATEWRVSNIPQDQREVWKLAEVGLLNARIVKRLNYRIYSNKAPEGGPNGDGSVDVPYFFALYDSLISETVQMLIKWTGVYDQDYNANGSPGTSNIWRQPVGRKTGTGLSSSEMVGGTHWHQLSSLKWSLLEDITSAQVHTADVRDAFISFMASECGDELSAFIDIGKFVSSQHTSGASTPDTVFSKAGGGLDGFGYDNYYNIYGKLKQQFVPVIPSVRNLVRAQRQYYSQSASGSVNKDTQDRSNFMSFLPRDQRNHIYASVREIGVLDCGTYFSILMDAFRWEAGHIFYQMVTSKMPLLQPEEIVYGLFYGWGIRGCSSGTSYCDASNRTSELNTEQQFSFLKDLILVYLIRNEMRMSPKIFTNPRFSNASKIEDYTKTHMRTIGEKTKYGEIFTWSGLVPYIQGVLLYMLAMGYPLACVLIVVPGWHKTLFTWMSFWAWAKLWDAGFAVVMVIERSVWAMMGNSSDSQGITGKIVDMQYMMPTKLTFNCNESDLPYGSGQFSCYVPQVCDGTCSAPGVDAAGALLSDERRQEIFRGLMWLFDRTLTLTSNLDLDLVNSYYVYIMGALYLAVPVVTGQLVLGAKAGVAGMVGTMIGGVSGEAGRAAGSAFSSDMTQKAKSAGAALGQTGYLKGLRGASSEMFGADGKPVIDPATGKPKRMGLTHAMFDAGNKGAELGALGMAGSQMREAFGHRSAVLGANYGALTAKGTQYANVLGLGMGAAVRSAQGFMPGQSPTSGTSPGVNRPSSRADAPITAGADQITNPQGGDGDKGGGNKVDRGGGGNKDENASTFGAKLKAGAERFGQPTLNMGFNAMGAYAGSVGEGVNAAVTVGYNQESAANAAGQASAAAITYLGQGYERGYGLAQQRLGAQAHFTGENEAWTMKNDYANALAGDLAAMGVSAAVLDPGPKPANVEGAAMAGLLDNQVHNPDGSVDKNSIFGMSHFADHAGSAYFGQIDAGYQEFKDQFNLAKMWNEPTLGDISGLYHEYLKENPVQNAALTAVEQTAEKMGLFHEPVSSGVPDAGRDSAVNNAANQIHGTKVNQGESLVPMSTRQDQGHDIFGKVGKQIVKDPELQRVFNK